jgi:glutaminase
MTDHERALAAAEQACKAWDHPLPVAVLEKVIEAYMRECPLQKRCEELVEHGQNFANQVRAVVYHLNGQAYSSTVSELNQFDAELRRARAALSAKEQR